MCDVSGAWRHIDEAQDMWAGRGGSWGLSSMGHEHGMCRGCEWGLGHIDEAWDASTLIYASMLEYIYLCAWASATNREWDGEAIYMDENPMRNRKEHADDRNMDLLLCGPHVRPAGAGAVAPSLVA